MVERGVHGLSPSIFLNKSIIGVRLIEYEPGRIVKVVTTSRDQEKTMSILSVLSRYARDYRARRTRMRTSLRIASLPADIRKDIGWTGRDEPRRRKR
jgi:hypothetical protein